MENWIKSLNMIESESNTLKIAFNLVTHSLTRARAHTRTQILVIEPRTWLSFLRGCGCACAHVYVCLFRYSSFFFLSIHVVIDGELTVSLSLVSSLFASSLVFHFLCAFSVVVTFTVCRCKFESVNHLKNVTHKRDQRIENCTIARFSFQI